MKKIPFILTLFWATNLFGKMISVTDHKGNPLSNVMVTQFLKTKSDPDLSDGGFAKPNTLQSVDEEITTFSDKNGRTQIIDWNKPSVLRFRKPGHKDLFEDSNKLKFQMELETNPINLASAKPASAWLGALNIRSAVKLHPKAKEHFQMQCGFCHQMGHQFTSQERTEEEWREVIKRMIGYGSRLPSDLQKSLPTILPIAFNELRTNPKLIMDPKPWDDRLEKVKISQWPVGNQMSQMHDMLFKEKGIVYLADNIQDRLYEIDVIKNTFKVHKIPHRDGEKNGGLIAARLKEFPSHDSTSNAHSLAMSKKDGHIFITPSAQKRLVEFIPDTGKFILHEMPDGFYPHTIRIDQKDRVWFTLALSNQVACFDRVTQKFKIYDLPTRNFKEKMVTKYIQYLFKIMDFGIPVSKWLSIDWESTGVPLVYGIDITPDGKVWFARLHTQEIGSIDPITDKIEMYQTLSLGPRRLRSDLEGNLWIANFGASSISRFNPRTKIFDEFSLPVNPKGSETPYALNVDLKRNLVWVTGNQSDVLYRFNPVTQDWLVFPLPNKTSFTRDIDFDEEGNAYTSNSNFPSWQIENEQPTLIRVKP